MVWVSSHIEYGGRHNPAGKVDGKKMKPLTDLHLKTHIVGPNVDMVGVLWLKLETVGLHQTSS